MLHIFVNEIREIAECYKRGGLQDIWEEYLHDFWNVVDWTSMITAVQLSY